MQSGLEKGCYSLLPITLDLSLIIIVHTHNLHQAVHSKIKLSKSGKTVHLDYGVKGVNLTLKLFNLANSILSWYKYTLRISCLSCFQSWINNPLKSQILIIVPSDTLVVD